MKKIAFVSLLALGVVVGLPALSSAATYSYVAMSGDVQTTQAATPTEAIAVAPNRMHNSGVVLGEAEAAFGVGGIGGNGTAIITTDVNGNGTITYQYVDVTGDVDSIEALNAEHALTIPTNRATHSGVYMAEMNPIPESVHVPVNK